MKKPLLHHYLITSLIIHVLCIFIFVVASHDSTIHKKFIVLGAHSQKPTHSLYKPLHGMVPFVGNRKSSTNQTSSATSNKAASKKAQQSKAKPKPKKQANPTPRKNKARHQEKRISKADKETSFEEEEEISREKKSSKSKKHTKKEQKKKAPKKIKPVIKPEPEEEQENPEKLEEPDQEEKLDLEENLQEIQADENHTDEQEDGLAENEILQFSFGEEIDPRLRRYQEHIQAEVSRQWHPPVGVPKGTECTVCFHIDEQGAVAKCEFLQRSTILIYDLSISRIAKNFTFDKCLWGKTFIIDFRQ